MHKEDVVCTVEYYLVIKKNKILPFAATWMDLLSVEGKEILLAVQVVRHHFALKNLDKGGTGDLREIREVKMSHVLKRLHQRQIREETRDATSPRQRESS